MTTSGQERENPYPVLPVLINLITEQAFIFGPHFTKPSKIDSPKGDSDTVRDKLVESARIFVSPKSGTVNELLTNIMHGTEAAKIVPVHHYPSPDSSSRALLLFDDIVATHEVFIKDVVEIYDPEAVKRQKIRAGETSRTAVFGRRIWVDFYPSIEEARDAYLAVSGEHVEKSGNDLENQEGPESIDRNSDLKELLRNPKALRNMLSLNLLRYGVSNLLGRLSKAIAPN